MSYCRKEGKDQVIFVTKEDHEKNTANPLLGDKDEQVGLIKPDGDINWECPCLQGMADGPCGEPFKDAFSCFHYSVSEPKGVDCLVQFKSMQECFLQYPEIYGSLDDDENNENESKENESESKDNKAGEITDDISNDDKSGQQNLDNNLAISIDNNKS